MSERTSEGGAPPQDESRHAFEEELAADRRAERALAWKEILAIAVVLVVVLLHQLG